MTSQRHWIQNGITMLVTTNVKNKEWFFIDDTFAREAIDVLYKVQMMYPFFLYGFVIMSNHCHFLIRVPEKGSISKIMNRFKMGVSHSIGMGPIWQPRFHIALVNNPWAALRYIHLNPVRAGICECPEDYPWSSASGKWDVMNLEWF